MLGLATDRCWSFDEAATEFFDVNETEDRVFLLLETSEIAGVTSAAAAFCLRWMRLLARLGAILLKQNPIVNKQN